ncbi:hypothetical protein J6590_050091 [Homalodisca vitripennis]|nr:hypothetical protein J6590_050091 [Homalodisca vitripennis]
MTGTCRCDIPGEQIRSDPLGGDLGLGLWEDDCGGGVGEDKLRMNEPRGTQRMRNERRDERREEGKGGGNRFPACYRPSTLGN